MSLTGLAHRPRALSTSLTVFLVLVTASGVGVAPAWGQGSGAFGFVKSGALDPGSDGVADPGDLINYTFDFTGQMSECDDILNIAVTDPLVPTIVCPSGDNTIPVLGDGDAVSCTGSYPITQEDINRGTVHNMASATGMDCESSATVIANHTEFIPQEPAIELAKHADLDAGADGIPNPGELIEYTLIVTNTGNVPLVNATLTDPVITGLDCPSGHPIPTLDVGADETCTGSYAITQDDIDAGSKDNTAQVSAESGGLRDEAAEPITDEASVSLPILQLPLVELVKSGELDVGGNGEADPGDEIPYGFEVTNAGNVTLYDVSVSDPIVPMITCLAGDPIPTMAPGAVETCSGSYSITADDISAGERDNTAEVTALTPGEMPVSATADHSVAIPVGGVDLAKHGDLDLGADGTANPGDLISYDLVVTNTGNVALENVTLVDPVLVSFDCPSGHPIPFLDVEAVETCTGTYAITQEDIDAGMKENTAQVTADEVIGEGASAGDARRAAGQAMLQVMIPQQPLIEVTKTGVLDLGGDGYADPGDLINYTFVVSNPGNVTISGVAVNDPLIGTVDCPSGNPIPTLAPMGSETCTGTYTLTAADIAAGSRSNTADASGMDPMTQPVSDGDSDTVTLPAAPVPSLPPIGLLILLLVLVSAGGLALRRRQAPR